MNRIREVREAKGITQQALANLVGVSRPYIVDLEKNRRGARPETWARIAEALGIRPSELVRMLEEDGCQTNCMIQKEGG